MKRSLVKSRKHPVETAEACGQLVSLLADPVWPETEPDPYDHKLVLTDVVDEDMFAHVAHQVLNLDASLDRLTVIISSPGGVLDYGLAIIDLLRTTRLPITTVALGMVGTAAADIFLNGDERLIGPNATIGLHDVRIRTAEDMVITPPKAQDLNRTLKTSVQRARRRICKATGRPMSVVKQWCIEERNFTGRQAVKHGLAHRLLPTG